MCVYVCLSHGLQLYPNCNINCTTRLVSAFDAALNHSSRVASTLGYIETDPSALDLERKHMAGLDKAPHTHTHTHERHEVKTVTGVS